MGSDKDDGFLSRWSRRKALVRQGVQPEPAEAERAAPRPAAGGATGGPPASRPVEAGHAAIATPVRAAVGPGDDTAPSVSAATPSGAQPADPRPDVPPSPTLDEARALTPESDFRRFVQPEVTPEVRNAALRQLFTDPHFNVMDGLDIYIDDYGRPDPIPASMLRQMAQAKFLNLFDDEPESAGAGQHPSTPVLASDASHDLSLAESIAPAAAGDASNAPKHPEPAPDEDPDLRLQPHDAAGPDGAQPSAVQDAGRLA
jgi:hypothetical protein